MTVLQTARQLFSPILSIRSWKMLGKYVGLGKNSKNAPISDTEGLAEYINSRASHVSQTSLYGYLKTRAGTRFPELFENPDILRSINIAKWHIWIACVSDLAIFIGQLARQSEYTSDDIIRVMSDTFDQIIDTIGIPDEAGDNFNSDIDKARQRIANFDLSDSATDDDIFNQSPEALLYWSPIADELKQRDETIVRNSIRFRWIDIRRSCRNLIKLEPLFSSSPGPN